MSSIDPILPQNPTAIEFRTVPTFDPTRPFYPMVLNHLAMMRGLLDLFARADVIELRQALGQGFRDRAMDTFHVDVLPCVNIDPYCIFGSDAEGSRSLVQADYPDSWLMIDPYVEFRMKTVLTSRFHHAGHSIHAKELVPMVMPGQERQIDNVAGAAGNLLILAWENVVGPLQLVSPMVEFLRHARNAAAHGNRFKFHPKQPKNKAEWRGLAITRQLEGSTLIIDSTQKGMFSMFDPVLLLWDIEQEFWSK